MPSSRYTKRYGPILGDFAQFNAGEYGAIGGRHAASNQFTGKNVLVYLDGSIGPRPGLTRITPFASTTLPPPLEPNGVALLGRERAGGQGVYLIDNDGYVWAGPDLGGGFGQWVKLPDTIAMYPALPRVIDAVGDGTDTYVASVAEETYHIDHAANTVTAVPGSIGGRTIAIFGDRLVVGGPVDGTLIRFSAANNYESWPALNFLEVGPSAATIVSFQVQRNLLVVTFRDGSIFTISGTLGVNEVVRQFTATTPRDQKIWPWRVALTKRGLMWRRGRGGVPESFDGTQLRALPYLNNWMLSDPETADLAVAPGPDDDDVIFLGAHGALLVLHNGLWTKHELGINDGTIDAHGTDSGVVRCVYDVDGALLLATQQSDGHVNVYTLAVPTERVPCEALGDTVVDAGTNAYPDCSFTLPELRDSAGRRMQLRSVGVRFTAYDTGSGRVPHLRVVPHAHDAYQTFESDDIAPLEWTGDGSDPVGGRRWDQQFGFDAGMDRSAYSVTIDQIVGVKIDEVVVYGTIALEEGL